MGLRKQRLAGFSLIELMVVISIIAVLVAYAIPQYGMFVIKAARTEMYTNTRVMANLAEAFFANHERYPLPAQFGLKKEFVDGSTSEILCDSWGDVTLSPSGALQSELGFQISLEACNKLRYNYHFFGSSTDVSGTIIPSNTFTITAYSIHTHTNDSEIESWGHNIPAKFCRRDSNGNLQFCDRWTLQKGKGLEVDPTCDALKLCF